MQDFVLDNREDFLHYPILHKFGGSLKRQDMQVKI